MCHSGLVSESPYEGNNPDEILKQVQDDTASCVLRSFLRTSDVSQSHHSPLPRRNKMNNRYVLRFLPAAAILKG